MTAIAGDDAYPYTRDAPLSGFVDHGPSSDIAAVTTYTVPLDVKTFAVTGMLFDFEPWRAPNRNPMPRLVPFPRLARAERRARATLQRLADALDALRHGLPETDW